MNTYRIKLHPKGPWATPFQADTLFGHICWMIVQKGDDLGKFLEPFKNNKPRFLLSDGFIGDNLPFPLYNPMLSSVILDNDQYALRYKKPFLKQESLSKSDFVEFINSENPKQDLEELYNYYVIKQECLKCLSEPEKDWFRVHKEQVNLKNSIQRNTFTTSPEGGGLYPLKEWFLRKGEWISVYVRCEENYLAELTGYLKQVGMTGYGKKKSIGKGVFEISDEPDEIDDLNNEPGEPFVTLSPFIPEQDQINVKESFYKLRLKQGKLGEQFANSGRPFAKNPLVMFEPGSIFIPINGATQFGQLIKDMVPGGECDLKKIVHYAYAFLVPVNKKLFLQPDLIKEDTT
jgi:CRISPR-associated protein Csm4